MSSFVIFRIGPAEAFRSQNPTALAHIQPLAKRRKI